MRSSPAAGTRQAKPRRASERSTQTSSAPLPGRPGARCGWTSRPRRERRLGRLVAAVGEHPAPAERVDDQRGVQVAAVGVHDVAACARSTLAVSKRAAPHCAHSSRQSVR